MSRRFGWKRAGVMALVLALAGGGVAFAGAELESSGPQAAVSAKVPGRDQVVSQTDAARAEATAILKSLSMLAFIDPATGQLRPPTPDEVKQLAAAGARLRDLASVSSAVEFPGTSGVAAEVPAELQSAAVATISPSGAVAVGCSAEGGQASGPEEQ